MSIGSKIKKLRKEKEMTLQQLADIMGCSPQLISQYENEKRIPKVETIAKIANALGVSLSDLDKRSYDLYTNKLIDAHFDNEASHLQELVNNINYLNGYTFHSELGLSQRYEISNREKLIDTLWIDYPDGDRLYIDYDDLFDLNDDTDSYLKFKLEELRKKKQK